MIRMGKCIPHKWVKPACSAAEAVQRIKMCVTRSGFPPFSSNNTGADQTARMGNLICIGIARICTLEVGFILAGSISFSLLCHYNKFVLHLTWDKNYNASLKLS